MFQAVSREASLQLAGSRAVQLSRSEGCGDAAAGRSTAVTS